MRGSADGAALRWAVQAFALGHLLGEQAHTGAHAQAFNTLYINQSAAGCRGARGGGGEGEALGDVGRPLPGLDLATLLDASAYHTTRDAPDRIRPGTLQARRGACVPAPCRGSSRAAQGSALFEPPCSPGLYARASRS